MKHSLSYPSLVVCTIAVLTFLSPPVKAQKESRYDMLRKESSRELVERGERLLRQHGSIDSALVCFSIVTARHSPDMSREEQQLCVDADHGKCAIYFSILFDFPKAYEALQHALEICEREGFDKSKIETSTGGIFQMMAEQSGDKDLYRQATEHYASGFRNSLATGNYDTVDKAYINILTIANNTGETATARSLWPEYSRIPCSKSDHRRRFARVFHDALFSPSLEEGAKMMMEATRYVPESYAVFRLKYIGLNTAANMMLKSGNLTEAETITRQAREYARKVKMIDGEMESTLTHSEILKKLGRTGESHDVRDEYLRLKEQILGSKQIQRLDELRFLADIRKSEEQVAKMTESRRRQNLIIFFLLALTIAIGALLWVFFSKNARLRQTYDSLYRQFQTNLAGEERERNLRKLLQQQLDQHRQEHHKDYKETVATTGGDQDEADTDCQKQSVKYQSSNLGEEEKQRILAKIQELVATPEVVCSAECSVSRMAEMAECHHKYLSQIINEVYGCNFNTFINEYRIKEASRRMAPGAEWERYTIEAIANSVGFKSRTTFISLFKHFTGMTPSEYKRRAT